MYVSSKHSDPCVKLARKQLADSYRLMRRDNAAITRLVYRHAKAVERELVGKITDSVMNGTGEGGLCSLL